MTKRKKGIKPHFYILLGLFSILLVIILWFFESRNSIWNKYTNTTLILNTKPVLLISFNHINNELNIFSIPSNVFLEVSGGYGKYRIGKLFALDKQEKRSGKLILNSASNAFGIPVDGFIDFNQKELSKKEEDFKRDDFFATKNSLMAGLDTLTFGNLTISDVIKFDYSVLIVRGSKVKITNLFQNYAFTPIQLPDYNKAFIFDYRIIDSFLRLSGGDQKIVQENLKVEILNSTKYSGLAEKAARIIENAGGKVVNIGNVEKLSLLKCQIYSDKNLVKSYTFLRLKKFFECQMNVGKYSESRSDITIVLGDNYRRNFEND